jgi:hypothetical protein
MRNQVGIAQVERRTESITAQRNTPTIDASWQRLNLELTNEENHFSKERVEVKVEKFREGMRNAPKPKNKLQRRTGIETTPMMLDRTRYSDLRSQRDTPLILIELQYRGLATDGRWKNDLMPRLKENEGDKRTFKPQSPEVSFDHIILA